MSFRIFFILLCLLGCLVGTVFVCRAYFTNSNNQSIRLGFSAWEGPQVTLLEAPEGGVGNELVVKVKAEDANFPVKKFWYAVYSHTRGDERSDWVVDFKEVGCLDGNCDSGEEEAEINLSLSAIQNPNHALCQENADWCQGKPLPEEDYYLLIWAYNQSPAMEGEGNKGEGLLVPFRKLNSQLICAPSIIYVRAGESFNFPAAACPDEPALTEIKWDVDDGDGIDWDNPNLGGETPAFSGYTLPGVYKSKVKVKNELGEEKEQVIEVSVANPYLAGGDILINEIFPNPEGDDAAARPDGEWIELLNMLDKGVDLLGFTLYDKDPKHELVITEKQCGDNTTMLLPYSRKLIYRAGDGDFSLNNTGEEEVILREGFWENGASAIDAVFYDGSVEGESWARVPDGGNEFVLGIPTPGS